MKHTPKGRVSMIFSNLFFLYLFFPICILCYFATKKNSYRNAVLIVFSLLFYACGQLNFLWLILLSALLNFVFGRAIEKWKGKAPATFFLALGLICNLGTLVVFKYTGFLLENINQLFHCNLPIPNLPLPLGISFFTFRLVSYLIDCAWGKVHAEKNFFTFLLYVSFFPITVSGPIARYASMQKDLHSRSISAYDISEGFGRIAIGLGKKVILADNLAPIVEQFLGNSLIDQTTFGLWYGIIVYSMQMYFDFSGYSDIAIGIARIFGFRVEENFRHPFLCRDITEFWQRWHITLGSFFRDYLLYVPIFGKRRKYAGLFLVWFCTGLWHGASWNFVFWGLYYGMFIFFEMLIGKKRMKKMPVPLAHIYTKLVIFIGFGIFYFENLGSLGTFFKALVGANGNKLTDTVTQHLFMNNIWLFAVAVLFTMPVIPKIKEKALSAKGTAYFMQSAGILCNAAILVLSSVLLVNTTNNPFLYFRF